MKWKFTQISNEIWNPDLHRFQMKSFETAHLKLSFKFLPENDKVSCDKEIFTDEKAQFHFLVTSVTFSALTFWYRRL